MSFFAISLIDPLLVLKSVAAATSLYLGVSAVYIDFKDPENKTKKTAYIVVFSISVVLGFLLDFYKGQQDKIDSEKEFNKVITTDSNSLSQTSNKLSIQLDSLNKLNNSINTKLTGVSKGEKNLTNLTDTIHTISRNINVNLVGAIDSLRILNNGQKITLKDIKRNLYSLNNMSLSYNIEWDARNRQLVNYSERIKTYINAAKTTAAFSDVLSAFGKKEFALFDNGNIEATFSSANLQLEDIIIKNESSMLPSCKVADEASICTDVLFDALYFNFTKRSTAIYYASYAFSDSNECGKHDFSVPFFPVGSSAVEVHMHFGADGKLSAFDCSYSTNRIELIPPSKGIVSQMELLGCNFEIQRFKLGNFRIHRFRGFSMNFNGSLEGLQIGDISNDEYSDQMVIEHKVSERDFLFDIFNN